MKQYERPRSIPIAEANRDGFFPSGLEYNPPARGTWNIVHTGMLLPEAHQIYACAQGCLRGVVLTAAEMNAMERMSWIALTEADMTAGQLEESVIDGVNAIIDGLPYRPKVILLFFSCMHLFAGCDVPHIIAQLSEMHVDMHFTDCYMIPTMRQNMPPAVLTAAALYDALQPLPTNPKAVSILGNDRPTDENAELVRMLRENGYVLRDITLCRTFDEYLQMAEAALNLTYLPVAKMAGEQLQKRLGIPWLHLPVCFHYDEIAECYRLLCETLQIPLPDFSADIADAEHALETAATMLDGMHVAIDFTAVSRPFELAELLYDHGMNVRYVIADAAGEDGAFFDRLQLKCPEIRVYQAVNVNMLQMHAEPHEPVLCIGQKAAHYFASDHFVNIVANGGYYGYAGVKAMAELIMDAFTHPKDRKTVLRHKGIGCESCLM